MSPRGGAAPLAFPERAALVSLPFPSSAGAACVGGCRDSDYELPACEAARECKGLVSSGHTRVRELPLGRD